MLGSARSPSLARTTGSFARRPSTSAIIVLCRGSRCCTTTTGTGNPPGRPPRTRLRALMPPADAAMATTSYGWPESPLNSSGTLMAVPLEPDIRTYGKPSYLDQDARPCSMGCGSFAIITSQQRPPIQFWRQRDPGHRPDSARLEAAHDEPTCFEAPA